MIKNIYRVLILNDKTSFNKSISINEKYLYLIVLLVFLIMGFSMFGVYKLFYPHPKQKEANYLQSKYEDTADLLENLVATNKILLPVLAILLNAFKLLSRLSTV